MLKCLFQTATAAIAALSALVTLTPLTATAESSAFRCDGLSRGHHHASVEGQDGVFFRLIPDLRNDQPLPDPVIDELRALSHALAAGGTTLVLAQVPTKALAMPHALNTRTGDFGYDPDTATTLYLDTLRRLRDAGIHAVNVRDTMIMSGTEPFFKTDHRLNAAGAKAMAAAIAAHIRKFPDTDALARHVYTTRESGSATLASSLRPALQQRCQQFLPEVTTPVFRTTLSAAAETGDVGVIALVGSEYSNTPEVNFAGFLAQETGFDVIQYSVNGGGAFAAISTYLTSREFQAARPDILVWELPVYANPGARGLLALQELVTAARNSCTFDISITRDETSPRLLTGDLSNLPEGPPPVLLLDLDQQIARSVRFRFLNSDGAVLSRIIERHPAQLPTGRFYMPTTALWPEGTITVEMTSDTDIGPNPQLFACDGGAK